MHSILHLVSGLVRKRKIEADEQSLHRDIISIVSLFGAVQDRRVAEEAGGQNHWEMVFANGCDEARVLSDRIKPQIILFDRDAAGADWRQEVSVLATASGGACVLLISTVADDNLWNEVVLNGGYDVLRKPLREADLLRAVKLAWSYWNGIRQIATMTKK
jgi:AmiR/NasT family two-component response regulator